MALAGWGRGRVSAGWLLMVAVVVVIMAIVVVMLVFVIVVPIIIVVDPAVGQSTQAHGNDHQAEGDAVRLAAVSHTGRLCVGFTPANTGRGGR